MIFDRIKSIVTLQGVRDETKSLYIARPEQAAGQLIYKHPDQSIPRGAKLTVRSDECALFFREGKLVARVDAGTELLDTANLPFLGHFLIDKFTDANHFICELFFVSLYECSLSLPGHRLGQYKDLNSANLVEIDGSLSYTVRVVEPGQLITQLGGQNAYSGEAVREVINGRMLNFFRKAVGLRAQRAPVLNVVSNIDSEAIAQEIANLATLEFTPLGLGLGRIFDLTLSLDEASLQLLRDFGKQEANLVLQEKGSRIATQEGFETFNLMQGQRAALEGMGKGMAVGNGPLVMSGGMGDLTRRSPQGLRQVSAGAGRGPSVLPTQSLFLVLTDRGATGPYSARQVALMAISKGQALSEVQIRASDDPPEVAFSADLEPQIVSEYKRRAPPGTA
jgi:membrane protease subunit (stomatin/prohibitin family)